MKKNRKLLIGVLFALSCVFTACGVQNSNGASSNSASSGSSESHYHYCKKVAATEPTCTS